MDQTDGPAARVRSAGVAGPLSQLRVRQNGWIDQRARCQPGAPRLEPVPPGHGRHGSAKSAELGLRRLQRRSRQHAITPDSSHLLPTTDTKLHAAPVARIQTGRHFACGGACYTGDREGAATTRSGLASNRTVKHSGTSRLYPRCPNTGRRWSGSRTWRRLCLSTMKSISTRRGKFQVGCCPEPIEVSSTRATGSSEGLELLNVR